MTDGSTRARGGRRGSRGDAQRALPPTARRRRHDRPPTCSCTGRRRTSSSARTSCSPRARTAGSAATRTWASTETPSGWTSGAPIPRPCPRCSRRSSSGRSRKSRTRSSGATPRPRTRRSSSCSSGRATEGAPLVPHADRPRRRSLRARVARRRLGPHDARGRGAAGLRGADGVVRGHVDVRPRSVRELARTGWSRSRRSTVAVVRRRAGRRASRASSSRGRPRTSPASAGCASSACCRSTGSAAWGRRCSRHTFAEYARRGFTARRARSRRREPDGRGSRLRAGRDARRADESDLREASGIIEGSWPSHG